jgi:hypothetical protein
MFVHHIVRERKRPMQIASRSSVDGVAVSPRRARNAAHLDGRVRMAKRLKAVLAELSAQYGDVERPLLQRCAELRVLAEQARARLVRGEPGATVDETVKLENLLTRALRDLQARTKRTPAPVESFATIAARAQAAADVRRTRELAADDEDDDQAEAPAADAAEEPDQS